MSRGLAALGVASALALAACTPRDDAADLLPPPGYAPPPFHPLAGPVPPGSHVGFGEGFYGLEASPEGRTWRWMSKRGTVHLPCDGRSKLLRLAGAAPIDLLKEPPTITVTLDGRLLERFVDPKGVFAGRYIIPGERLAAPTAELIIETSATARPAEDPRDLGVSVELVDWRDLPRR